MTMPRVMIILGGLDTLLGASMLAWAILGRAARWWRAQAVMFIAMGLGFAIPNYLRERPARLTVSIAAAVVTLIAAIAAVKLMNRDRRFAKTR